MRDLAHLPKAHLHVHLESTVRWTTLREIAAGNGVEIPDLPGDGRLAFNGFRQFADHNALVRGCLRRYEDFARIAREFCADEAAQGTRYAEVTFTAAAHGERLGRPEMPLEAVLQGLAEGRAAHGIECRVILDHSRRRSVERARRTLDLATRYTANGDGGGVVGLGMAGEESYSLAPFAEVIDEARDSGLHIVHHAGEACGPASIREAIGIGRTERLGHGIRVLDDDDLVAEVRDRQLPLEVCPSSNTALGFAPSLGDHPLPRLREAGVIVTVNTDIPAIVGTDLTREFTALREVYGYNDPTIAELSRAGIDASFAPAPTKARLHRLTDEWLAASSG
ncbi:adenosine deaminase [Nocardiopsis gilva YIM 90087]|uniref:Adenosine deaminase n=1 Tax=Nocardiopsis gilva YIM 90087 TaxID=1235441 RepID=A0A223S7M8_9ACTN|nr:adenosine deaminase [Nocardiopsis gilva]ASU84089.1 adenosine deaminase [Nocardiopsis gilva YIM 90087]